MKKMIITMADAMDHLIPKVKIQLTIGGETTSDVFFHFTEQTYDLHRALRVYFPLQVEEGKKFDQIDQTLQKWVIGDLSNIVCEQCGLKNHMHVLVKKYRLYDWDGEWYYDVYSTEEHTISFDML
jgi:phenolic acid decarboxylase